MRLFMRRAEGHNSIIRSRSSWGRWLVAVKNTWAGPATEPKGNMTGTVTIRIGVSETAGMCG